MPNVDTENCIRCLYMDCYMDCVSVCPVDCLREGEALLVIHPEDGIDCGICESACPAEAIRLDDDKEARRWLAFNARFAEEWPRITEMGTPPVDAEDWRGHPGTSAMVVGAAGP